MEWGNNSGGLYAIFNGGNTSIRNNTNITGFGGERFVAKNESMPVRVMTEEQVEDLRKQICAFGVISERLVEMHRRNMFPQQDSFGETSHCNPLMLCGHKITARQRWNPTAKQLEILDSIFNRGKTTTPTKQKIKEIAAELAQHGPISENNVYNWFQNRRARCKRKQAAVGSSRGKKVRAEEEGNFDVSPESVANNTENVGTSRTDDIRSSDSSGQLLFVEDVTASPS